MRPQRNLAAELRAIEEGHRARLDSERHCLLVKSDSSDRNYELVPRAIGGYLVVSCTCPAGQHRSAPIGDLVCKHAALVARRLERYGLVRFDGRSWRIPDEVAPPTPVYDDPFDGLD